jgi:hypothetical protein
MRRFLAALISLMVALNFAWVKPASAAIDYSTIRVKLTSMGTPANIEFSVKGDYSIKEDLSIGLKQDVNYNLKLENGSMILSDGTSSWPLGNKAYFQQRYCSTGQDHKDPDHPTSWLHHVHRFVLAQCGS